MTTSGSYDNASTMSEIIRDAYSLTNIIDDSEPLSADKWAYGKRMLNDFINFLSIHKGTWLTEDETITLTPGTNSYTVGIGQTINIPTPMDITAARRVQLGGNEIPITVESRDGYMSLPNKTLQAAANLVYYQKNRTTGTLYVWPTGTTDEVTLIITTHRPIQDFDEAGNNPDLPKEWVLCITYQLAAIISPKYLGGIVPADLKIMADQFLTALMLDDEEKTSVFIS